jgi:hypothetical protein
MCAVAGLSVGASLRFNSNRGHREASSVAEVRTSSHPKVPTVAPWKCPELCWFLDAGNKGTVRTLS